MAQDSSGVDSQQSVSAILHQVDSESILASLPDESLLGRCGAGSNGPRDEEDKASSVEVQADPSDLSSFELDFEDTKQDLDLMAFPSEPQPFGPALPPPPAPPPPTSDFDDSPLAGLFDHLEADATPDDVKSEDAVAGVCGFRNFANTCYMNSGLQCLFATSTVVKFFTEHLSEINKDDSKSLSSKFGPLVKEVWAGEYSTLKPLNFKSALEQAHSQFKGTHQHDCQEFLALLLGSLHEELKILNKNCSNNDCHKANSSYDCGTSMEIHTAHSTDREVPDSLHWMSSRNSSIDNNKTPSTAQARVEIDDGTESRGSTSPKSYDSITSSIEDKVASAIRKLPIPNEIKTSSEFEYDDDSSCSKITSNLVSDETLKKRAVHCMGLGANNESGLDFLTKENKTLNVNVLASNPCEEQIQNNKINFDSEKYHLTLTEKKTRPHETIDNNLMEGVSKVEKGKNTEAAVFNDFHAIKRIRLDSSDKNFQLELERKKHEEDFNGEEEIAEIGEIQIDQGMEEEVSTTPGASCVATNNLKQAVEADRCWERYLAMNDTVVARTFQGQFKNNIVCSKCGYVSVSFEPFMYLPVPLPNAHVRQTIVTFVSAVSGAKPTTFLLQLTHADNVSTIKEKLLDQDVKRRSETSKLQVVEVFEHHISRTVEDWTSLKYLKDKEENRQLYVIEMSSIEESSDANVSTDDGSTFEDPEKLLKEFSPTFPTTSSLPETVQSCVICMEDFPTSKLRQHNACDCVVCEPCLDRTVEHSQHENGSSNGVIKCPSCRQDASIESEFVTLDMIGKSMPKLKTLTLPLVFRTVAAVEVIKKQDIELFGHPTLFNIPNQITGKQLAKLVDDTLGQKVKYSLRLVNTQGKNCSRCLFNVQCYGCVIIDPNNAETKVLLQASDTIAVTISLSDLPPDFVSQQNQTDLHSSMSDVPRLPDTLDLEDCLKAFSETEVLDENNPWFCPICRKNQCATKTLTVWRFPDFLILYLKRFVFVSNSAGALKLDIDVSFKTNDLDLTPYLSGPLRHGQGEGRPVFNLYGCVCHFGSVYGGHYTAFSKHLGSGQWNYFDDCSVNNRKIPGESQGDASSAYILFYQRSGSRQESQVPSLSRKCQAFCGQCSPQQMCLKTNNESFINKDFSVPDEDMTADCPDLSQIIRSLDTPPPSS